jgi:hypothetical protein
MPANPRVFLLPCLFGGTLFLSAALLFCVQPMLGKMLLPLLGGAPGVWNTCMVFFQALLLGGYAYAHVSGARLGARRQAMLHLVMVALAGLCLPLGLSERAVVTLSNSPHPAPALLVTLAATVGWPFFVLSATGPLLQRWFSQSSHREAKDPYFLYAASNAGSLLALLSYPLVLEPCLRLLTQTWLWAAGYGFLALLVSACALAVGRGASGRDQTTPAGARALEAPPQNEKAPPPISWARRGWWTVLAFVPSSLMLGVTTFLSTDVAAVPLLWVIPLALYLATFILAFSRRQFVKRALLERAVPMGALILVFLLLSKATEPMGVLIVLHLGFFLIAGLFCHGQLAAERPAPARLTEFYLWLAVGGVLGGAFNALVAPVVFSTVVEYPLGVLLLCLLRGARGWAAGRGELSWRDFVLPAGIGGLTAALALLVANHSAVPPQWKTGGVFGVPLVISFLLVERPLGFALALAAVMLGGLWFPDQHGRTLHVERDFFGVSRVTLDPLGTFRRLVHGNTVHGRQFLEPDRQCEPLAYYHWSGPAGRVFKQFESAAVRPHVAVVGLGAGALACYAKPGQQWTIYEIDPAVVRIARDTNYFTYLTRCMGAPVQIVLGDARLRLREAPPRSYGLIVLDAFSSDAIPIHLLTREALELYLAKLASGGLLAFHISNRCLALAPVLAGLAADAHLVCLAREDDAVSPADIELGKESSHWVVMARRPTDLEKVRQDSRWKLAAPSPGREVWTDDFSNLLSAFKWR